MGIESYRELKVWQDGMDIARQIYLLTEDFPSREMYGLTNQMRRAAVSIPANIAEGHARDSTKEYLHHLSIAQGSLAELETFVALAQQLGYTDSARSEPILTQSQREGKMLHGLQSRLKQNLTGGP